MTCTFGSVATLPPSFVRTLSPSCPRFIASSLVPEEPKFFSGGGEEVPVIVFVLADLPLEEDIDAGDARLSQRVENELTPGSCARRGPTSAVGERDDESRPAPAEDRKSVV